MKIDHKILERRETPLFTPKKLESLKKITEIKLEEKRAGFFTKIARNIYKILFKKAK